MPSLTVKDLETLQAQHPDYRMELIEGEIIFMSPSGLESDEVALEIAAQLRNWVRPRKLGRVSGSSGGFRLPNKDGDVRAPDASFILAERLPRTTEDYAELVPDLTFEVKSKSDSLPKLRQKIQQFLELGTKVGVLVDPRTRTMEVYRLNQDKVVLGDGDVLQVPELLPGWELPIVEVWAPEFD
ncbi:MULTISPECIES: Uma2 family endonuclease [unclassified Moorena]|uniref:Uma2 family endonuclease n=1 Tax=unclassified Moorena TaxID=2683338 RepID=UPI0014010EC5|nr:MULTISPECIES: Uma2 family endonuclease [unclassified Moorena]NEO14319.1 Uma2 family endonuclease [Moorena sp. SIO3E8]NEQ00390.1 Uma2 family endonuclease [Moorena sp. SIO3F7]